MKPPKFIDNGKTLNIQKQNIAKLIELFPEIKTNEKIDFEKLKQILGEYVEDSDERYRFVWNGKGEALKISQTPSTGTLRPVKEESKEWNDTENLYIEGDNLEVLKLLQKSYFNKVKLIYIDPPYNTGGDFVYEDNFTDNIQNYKKVTGQIDEEGKATTTNREYSGRYHTDWLNMMYPRLRLARNLLQDDGVIFISIDDNEVHNLRKICDEIFGEDNFITNICHKSRGSISNDKIISQNHNHILLYAKRFQSTFNNRKNIGLDPILEGFSNEDNDIKGDYKLVPVDGPGGARKGNPYYEFLGVEGFFRYSKETMKKMHEEGTVVKRGNSLFRKYYKSAAMQSRKTDTSWWDDAGYTSSASTAFKKMMDGGVFDSPKPVSVITRMLKLFTHDDKDSIILDFFSGSATTAHAVMDANAKDNGNRKFMMVQLPETTDKKSEAHIAGYKNITDIGKERIRRAGEQIKAELKEKYEAANHDVQKAMKHPDDLDIGFKLFKLDASNIKEWNPGAYENVQLAIEDAQHPYVSGRTEADVVYEMMLKMGLDLTYPLEEYDVDGKTIYSIGYGFLMICLADDINIAVAEKMMELKEANSQQEFRTIFRDEGFTSDTNKTNIKETLRTAGLADESFITL